jgi:hypothetical protein
MPQLLHVLEWGLAAEEVVAEDSEWDAVEAAGNLKIDGFLSK